MKDRTWFERKVRELGDLLRRLPRSRQRAFVDAIETEMTAQKYPEHPSCRIYVPNGPPEPGSGTYTPLPPYDVEPETRQGSGGQLDDDAGESGVGAKEGVARVRPVRRSSRLGHPGGPIAT